MMYEEDKKKMPSAVKRVAIAFNEMALANL